MQQGNGAEAANGQANAVGAIQGQRAAIDQRDCRIIGQRGRQGQSAVWDCAAPLKVRLPSVVVALPT